MRRALCALLVSGSVLAGVLVADGSRQDQNKEQSARVFGKLCGTCHAADRIVGNRRDRAQWEEVLENMASKGATGTDDEFAIVLEYLVRNYGRVNVNKAPTDEIVSVLEVSTPEAEAIVSYRKAHGAFSDFDALTKVPGLDPKKLEQKRDAIAF